jgi:hypothetical protein
MTDPPGEQRPKVSVDRLREVLKLVTIVPTWWAILLGLGALLSAFNVKRETGGHWTVELAMSTTTLVLLALIWLPALVRVIALSGGGFKTPAGEASTAGLLEILQSLDSEQKREALPAVIAAVEQAETQVPHGQRGTAAGVRRQLEQELQRVEPAGPALASLRDIAASYEQLRRSMGSGGDRTLRMSRLVVQARAAASKGSISADELAQLFAEGDGGRVIALAAWQVRPDLAGFDQTIDAVASSHSAFEQYHGLLVAQAIAPSLASDQRATLRATLERQLRDPSVGLNADTSRRDLAEGILGRLR